MHIKLRAATKFLSSIFAGVGTVVRKDGLATYVDIDYRSFNQLPAIDPTTTYIAVQNIDGSFSSVSLATILVSTQTQQTKTNAGSVNVAPSDGLILINKTVGEVTDVFLPLAGNKIGPVLVSDLKRDAGVNAITIHPSGSETIAGVPSYAINSDGGSLFLRPVGGVGWVI